MFRFLPRRFVAIVPIVFCLSAHAVDFSWLTGRSSKEVGESSNPVFSKLSLETEADGVTWGTPLDSGNIRALVVAPRFTLRDVQALATQLSLDVELVPFWTASSIGAPEDVAPVPGTGTQETLDSLRAALDQNLDVIVIANVDMTGIPTAEFDLLVEKVRGGTGLVMAHHRKTDSPELQAFFAAIEPAPGNDIVTRGIGHQLTPEWPGGLGFVQSGSLGEGRVVELDYPGPRPETHCLIPSLTYGLQAEWEHFDTYLSLAARAIRWAAGRDPATSILRVEPEQLPAPSATELPAGLDTEVEGDALDLIRRQLIRPFIVQLDRPAAKGYSVRTRVRRPGMGSPVIATPVTSTLEKGETSTRVYLVAGSGQYYLDVWLLDKDEVVDWFTEAVVVEAWPVINNLTLNRATLLSQDALGLSFTMPPRDRPAAVLMRATDPWRRVVAESFVRVPPEAGLVKGSLDLDDLIGGPLKVEVFAVDRDAEFFTEWDTTYAAYAYRQVPVQVSNRESRLSLVATIDGSAEYNARSAYRTLGDAGVWGAHTEGTVDAVAFLADAGIEPIPRVAQYTPTSIVGGAVREPCFTDPAWLAVEAERLAAEVDFVRLAGANRFSLGDGNCLTTGTDPVCQSASAVDAYLQYLREVYGSGGSPQADHGTDADSATFDQWIDFRSFMDGVFTGFHADMCRQIRQVDNRLTAGFVARPGTNAFTGYDWPRLMRAVDWLAVPLDLRVVERVRSYRSGGQTFGLSVSSLGAAEGEGKLRWIPWYAALHGLDELWLPPLIATGNHVVNTPLIGPAGAWVDQAQDLFAAADDLSSGTQRLLREARRETSGIAVYDSRSSYYLNHAEPSFGCDSPTAESYFIELIRRLGYQFDYLSSEDVASGKLADFKVLILPMVRSMSEAELEAVRTFHANGGNLIADLSPGVYDQHGIPRAAPPLDDRFGVRHGTFPRASAPCAALIQIDLDGKRASGSFEGLIADASVEAVQAAVGGLAGTAPVWLIHRSTGIAALINHILPESGEYASMLATLLDTLLESCGIQRPVQIEGPAGARFRGEAFSCELDGNRLIALLADPGENSQDLRIVLPDAVAHYDAGNGRSISRYRNHSVTLGPGESALYAVLPYDVSGIDLEALPNVAAGERLPFTLGIKARKGVPTTHVVHVDLLSLQTEGSKRIAYYGRDVICRSGLGEGFIRLALNERPGVYKLVARDALTGMTAETVVKIMEP